MPIRNDFLPIITKHAGLNRLDPFWFQAIILTESAGDPYAIRYESNYKYIYEIEACAKKCGSSIPTELAAQRMSWGLGQIMGAVARQQGHKTMLSELLNPELNIKHMGIKLKDLNDKLSGVADEVFAAYNGGLVAAKKYNGAYINQAYVDRVNKNLDML